MKISADRVNKIILYKTIMSKYRILTHFENEQEQEQEIIVIVILIVLTCGCGP